MKGSNKATPKGKRRGSMTPKARAKSRKRKGKKKRLLAGGY